MLFLFEDKDIVDFQICIGVPLILQWARIFLNYRLYTINN